MPRNNTEITKTDKILLFEMDEETAPIPYAVPAEAWQAACQVMLIHFEDETNSLSDEDVQTQLVNALEALGIEAYVQLGEHNSDDNEG